jgi:hypothetical protein
MSQSMFNRAHDAIDLGSLQLEHLGIMECCTKLRTIALPPNCGS